MLNNPWLVSHKIFRFKQSKEMCPNPLYLKHWIVLGLEKEEWFELGTFSFLEVKKDDTFAIGAL